MIPAVAQRVKTQAARMVHGLGRLRSGARAGGVVLIYHRIAQPQADPWNISVSPRNFADHMEILRRFAVPRTFGDFAGRLNAGDPEPGVAVTFDDGYADNLLALPILEAQDVPATIFVVSGAVGNPPAFWWDLLTRIFLETPRLPQQLLLDAGGKPVVHDLGKAAIYSPADLSRSARWRADLTPPQDKRQSVYLAVWQELVGLEPDEILTAMDKLRAWAGLPETPAQNDARPVTQAELLRLADSPLVEIGGHTRTHADLARLSPEQAAGEIGGGRKDLMEMTGRDVRSFAYPYGRFGPRTVADIRDGGYAWAGCSRHGFATSRHDPSALPRVHATDLSADRFEAMLAGFLRPLRSRAKSV